MMADKVLAILRETSLHENSVERLSFHPATGQVILQILQPDERFSWPEHQLTLTFSGVVTLGIERKEQESRGEELLGIECVREGEMYQAEIRVGSGRESTSVIRITFRDLRYRRKPVWGDSGET